jgi:hypothetical protein
MKRLVLALLFAMLPTVAWGQTVIQGGSWTAGRLPMYSASGGGSQPIVQQSAPASGGSQSISELSLIARGTGTAPYVGQGTGYLGSRFCLYDGPTTGAYHQLCIDPNATGSKGLISYNAFGGASNQGFNFVLNGTTYTFPFSTSGVVGPATTTVGHVATWADTTGTLLADSGGTLLTIGGSNGMLQYNNAGALGGFTLGGDATVNTGTGALTITKIGGVNITLGGAFASGGTFASGGPVDFFDGSSSGALTRLRISGATDITLPTTGTVVTRTATEALTNKTYNGMTLNSTTGTFALTNGKTFTVSNTLGLAGTDGSTLNVGTGGTLGTAAYTAATAYVPANTQLTNSLAGNVALSNTASYFDGPSVAQGASGTWFASGTVTLSGNNGDEIYCRLTDGTNVISSSSIKFLTGALVGTMSLSGKIVTPPGNIRIACRNITSTATTAILFNQTSNSLDSTITAFRVN